MVDPQHTGQGVAYALHDELVSARKEQSATLLIRTGQPPGLSRQFAPGWRKASHLRLDGEHPPLFDVLILALPLSSRPPADG